MFATSSMAWIASLLARGGQNHVSQLTANVVRRFADPVPIVEVL